MDKGSLAWVGNLPFWTHIDTHYDVLFKYTKMKYAATMLNDGVFRIGTLYEYQGMEQGEIGDSGEGTKSYYIDTSLPAAPQIEKAQRQHPYWKNQTRPDFSNLRDGVPVVLQEWAPDCYMFCVSQEFDRDAMERFGYDACIEIRRPRDFFYSLSLAMFDRYAYAGMLRTCRYMARHTLIGDQPLPPPQIMKDTSFAHQKEVRLVWDPWPHPDLQKKEALTLVQHYWETPFVPPTPLLKAPIYLTCPAAAEHCRLIF